MSMQYGNTTVAVLTPDQLHEIVTDAIVSALKLKSLNVERKATPTPLQLPMMEEPPKQPTVKTWPVMEQERIPQEAKNVPPLGQVHPHARESKNGSFGMTTQEAAIELHVSAGTVNRLINDGKLPAIIIGRKRFIKRKDVAALIKRTR